MRSGRADAPIPFVKAHGIGNDYVILDARWLGDRDAAPLARLLCRRHTAVGADGLLVVGPHVEADFEMRMWNPDGSEAEMCGNGLRCAARYAAARDIVDGEPEVERTAMTAAGPLTVTLHAPGDGEPPEVTTTVGVPRIGALRDTPLEDGPQGLRLTEVSMGNPHVVAFVDDVATFPLAEVGPLLETHARFPDRTNVEIVALEGREILNLRTWERGVGETLACGTGACAALAAAVELGRAERSARIELRGGALRAIWPEGGAVRLRGAAVLVYEGRWEPS